MQTKAPVNTLKSRDEKVKLFATLLNTAAGSCLTVGVFAPIVALTINLGDAAANVPLWKASVCVAGFLIAAVLLHMLGRRMLNGLDQ
jgi:membrane protein implicated in regulation of membrane protease activity